MKAIAAAYKDRSLKGFQEALATFSTECTQDPIVHSHTASLYDKMLEQNIAKLIELPVNVVETKLSQMILDKVFSGTLDQGTGGLIIFEDPSIDQAYKSAVETFQTLDNVVDALMDRSQKIVA